jgi:aryl-alcohol dehydrogenase-like predicted oxidoreductase
LGYEKLQKRKLGNSGIEMSPLAFGGNVFGWTIDEPRSFELLDRFVDAGFEFIDTADIYATWAHGGVGGQSETILGNWLKRTGKRSNVILATKVGMEMGPDRKGLSKRYIQQSVEDSLKRLQTDYIDLYQSHADDKDTPLEETLSAFADLIKQGKVRAIGASNYTGSRLAEALRVSKENSLPRYESLQPLYNLAERSTFETDLESLCLKENIGVISYYSLSAGFLSGKYRSEADLSHRARAGRVKQFLNERGFAILQALDAVAKDYQATPAQVALAWLIARPSVTAPIASATSVQQLDELFGAVKLTLDPETIERLDRVSEEHVAATQ